jgi:anti-sigma B factor antagonist
MNIQRQQRTLVFSNIGELGAATALSFRQDACAALVPELEYIEIDLSQTTFVDSSGLGALVSVYKAANQCNNNGGVVLRLLNPLPPVQQVIELTRMHHLFEIQSRPEPADCALNGTAPASIVPSAK